MVRLFLPISGEPTEARVDGERLHYLVHVRRLRAGDALELFDGTGRVFRARVTRLEEDQAQLALEAPERRAAGTPVFIVQGLPKGDKLELVLQKATELGAAAIYPVSTERAVVKLDPKRAEDRRERWQRIAEEAARQCGRADRPSVESVMPLLEAIATLPPDTRVLVLDEEERSRRLASAFIAGTPTALVIGPEGGLARSEIAELTSRGAQPVTLGSLILRTETAALAALSVLRHLDGELG